MKSGTLESEMVAPSWVGLMSEGLAAMKGVRVRKATKALLRVGKYILTG